MNKSLKSGFKITKVRRCLKFKGVPSKGEMYIVYKVTGPRDLVKYFGYKKDATAWVKDFTTRHPMTASEMYDFYKGR
jgi:hypothetical protein